MARRTLTLSLLCLGLAGFSPCGAQVTRRLKDYDAQEKASEERMRTQQQECIALKSRLVSIEEEYAFGSAVSVNWVSTGGGLLASADAALLETQLNQIGRLVAAQSTRPALAWTFGVLASPGVNAVSGPGGYVFVSDGLLRQLDSEAELAGVLAHEIAHITGKHALNEYHGYLMDECLRMVKAEEMRSETELGVGLAKELVHSIPPGELKGLFDQLSPQGGFDFDKAGPALIQALTQGVLNRILEKGFDERDEFAADREAVELMVAAGYDPQAYLAFLGKLPEKGLSTAHPSKAERQERVRKQLASLRERAAAGEFTTALDLERTKVYPLRDTLLTHRAPPPAAPR